MRDVFQALPVEERARVKLEYVAYLRERNGAPDFDTKTCTKREGFFAELDAKPLIASESGRLDPATFARNQGAAKLDPDLDRATLWALCAANINLSEDWGVQYTFQLRKDRDPDDPYAWVLLEENYHTRLLADCVKTLGVEMAILPPKRTTRTILKALLNLPYAVSNMTILAAEIIGIAGFQLLKDEAAEIFAGEPEVRARILCLFDQIITDEIGHVRWLNSRLGPARLAVTRRVIPTLASAFLRDVPEIVQLFGRDRILGAIRELARSGHVELDGGRAHPLDVRLGHVEAAPDEVERVLALSLAA